MDTQKKERSKKLLLLIITVIILQTFYCFAIPNTNHSVHSCRHGRLIQTANNTTSSPQHYCSCFKGYSGSDCSIPVCFGLPATLKSVCGGANLQCTAPDTCSPKKQSRSLKVSSSCSNHGELNNLGTCNCNDGFYGETCQFSNCYDNVTKLTCSNRGTCSTDNICICNENDMYGESCQYTLPEKIYVDSCTGSCVKITGISEDAIPIQYTTLNNPTGLFVDEVTGFIFFADNGNERIRVLARDNMAYTIAALDSPTSIGINKQTRDIYIGTAYGLYLLNSKRVLSQLNNWYISSVVVDNEGHVIFSQSTMNKISKIVNGSLVAVAGTGSQGYNGDNKLATTATISNPSYLTYHSGSDSIYFMDRSNRRLRKISSNGYISTIAGGGTSSTYNSANALSLKLRNVIDTFVDIDNFVYFAETDSYTVWKIQSNGTVTKVFTYIYGVRSFHKLTNGDFVFSDYSYRITLFKSNSSRFVNLAGLYDEEEVNVNFIGDNGPANKASVNHPRSLYVKNNELYFADTFNSRVRKINLSTGILSTIAGNGAEKFSGDGGLGTLASLNYPYGIHLHSDGSIYIADTYNSRIRKLDSSNKISTVAGSDRFGYLDSTNPLNAQFNLAVSILKNNAGDMFISDYANNVLRKMNTSGVITTIAGSAKKAGFADSSDAKTALLNGPFGLYYQESTGTLFFADRFTSRIRKLTKEGAVQTVVSSINDPREISFHTKKGHMYISDGGELSIKVLFSNGTISTLNVPQDNYIGLYVDSDNDYLYASTYSFIYRFSIAEGEMAHNQTNPTTDNTQKNCTKGCEKGECINGTCICKENYSGEICDIPICYGKLNNDSTACSGNGVCQEPNVCYCYGMWEGEECSKCKPGFTGANCKLCVDGFMGRLCNIPLCFNVSSNSSSVCSGHGQCSSPNNCTCSGNWEGENCQDCKYGFTGTECDIPVCFEISSLDSSVCSGHGSCSSPDTCNCIDNWFGQDCSTCKQGYHGEDCQICESGYTGTNCDIPSCFGKSSNNSEVCSGNGICETPDNCKCYNGWNGSMCNECSSDYTGEECEIPYCYGVAANESLACSGNGACNYPDNCYCSNHWEGIACESCGAGFSGDDCNICDSDHTGENCDIPLCYGIGAGNESVCSGNGQCIKPSVCACFGLWTGSMCETCPVGYTGEYCNIPVCFDVSSNYTSVCSGHGRCDFPDQCICEGIWTGMMCQECPNSFSGPNCDIPVCFGSSIASNTSIVCSGHGQCQSPDSCLCEINWFGQNCDMCNIGFYGITCELLCDPNIEKPSLSIKQGSTISYTIGTSIAIEPEITIPFCYSGHFTSVTYSYVSDSFTQGQLVQVDKFLVIGESSKTNGTRIEQEGEFTFKLVALLGRLEISTSMEFVIKSKLAPLTLDFSIQNMFTQSYEKPLVFDVKASDPSLPNDFTNGQLTLNCVDSNNQQVDGLFESVVNYTISVSKVFNPGQYTCQATFKKDIRSISKSIQVVIIGMPSSNVFSISLQLQDQNPGWVNPSKDLTIKVITTEALSDSAVYEWNTPFQAVDSSVKNSLTILSNQFSLGTSYNVSLIITDGEKKGFGYIFFKTDSPPSIGSFAVTPVFGYSLTTTFTLNCGNDWLAANQDTLTYNFIYRSVGSLAWKSLTESSVQKSLNTTLPVGTWEVSVSVSDTFLSSVVFDKPITVQVNTTADLTVAQLNFVTSNPITPSVISSLISYVSSDSSSSEVKEQSKQIVIDSIKTSLTKETLDTTLTVSSLKSAISVIDSVSSAVSVFKDSESTVVLEYFSTVLHKTLSNGIQMSSDDIQLCLNSATKFEEYFFGTSKRHLTRATYETSIDYVTKIYNILTEVQFRKLKEGEDPSRISSLSFYSYCVFKKSQSIAPYSDTMTVNSLQFSLLQALNSSATALELPENSIVCLKMYFVQAWNSIVPSSYTAELSFLDVNNDYKSVSISRNQNIAKFTVPRMNTGVNQKQVCYQIGSSIQEGCSIASTSPLQVVIQTKQSGKFFVGYYVEPSTPTNPTNVDDYAMSTFVIVFAIIVPIFVCCCVCLCLSAICGCALKKIKNNAALYSHSILRSTQSLPLPNERVDVTFDDINVYNSGINSSPTLPLYIQPNEIKLLSKLGSGGYGSVFKAYWKDKLVAVKCTQVPDDSKQIEIPREAALMCNLKHPNFVELYGISIKGKEQMIIMEYVNGNLNQVIGDLCRKSIKMDLDDKIDIFMQIATGMNYMHQLKPTPIVHRDLTPANVLFEPRTKMCKICDFGLSKPLDLEGTETKNRGTIYYVPNELIYCSDPTLASNPCAIDVYSFSILAWQLIFEDHPYLYINKEKLFFDTKFKHTPYVDVTNDNLLSRVATGLRPVIPFNVDSVSKWTQKYIKSKYENDLIALSLLSITQMIQNCWNLNPQLRPTFQNVIDILHTCKSTLSSNHPLLV